MVTAVEREFQALRDFLARLDQHPSDDLAPAETVETSTVSDGHNRYWWIILRGTQRLTRVTALRERLSLLPGCVAAQVLAISSDEIRVGLTTESTVTQQQIEFAMTTCHYTDNVEIILRSSNGGE